MLKKCNYYARKHCTYEALSFYLTLYLLPITAVVDENENLNLLIVLNHELLLLLILMGILDLIIESSLGDF